MRELHGIDRRELNIRLCEFLGLDTTRVSAFSLHVSAAEWPRLEVTQFVAEIGEHFRHSLVLTPSSLQPPIDFMLILNADIAYRAEQAHEQIRGAFARSRKKLLGKYADLYQEARHA